MPSDPALSVLPARLRDVLATGVSQGEAVLPVRRVWPADLGDGAAGYVLECVGVDGSVAAVLDADGARLLGDDEIVDTLPALRQWQEGGGRVIAHRAYKRAVLRMPDGSFVKLAKKSATRRALARAATVDALLSGLPAAPLRPDVLASDAPAGWLRLAPARGRALDAILTGDDVRAAEQAADLVAAALATLATVPADESLDLPSHTGEMEAEILRSWAASAVHAAPEGMLTREQATRLLDRAHAVADRLAQHPALAAGAPGAVLAHRDLHEGQILVDADDISPAVTFLDWDTAAWTHPALDVANLLAHVQRGRALHPAPGWEAFEARLVAGLRQLDHPAAATAQAREVLDLLRDAARLRVFAVHAFRPGALDAAALYR